MPFEWKIPVFPSLCSLWPKCFLTVNLVLASVPSFPCECVKKWKLYPERESDLTWGLSYPLLVILFLPDCRDKELQTPFHKLSFFLLFKGFCTISALSQPCFHHHIKVRSQKYLLFFHIFVEIRGWHSGNIWHLTIFEGRKVIICLALCWIFFLCCFEYWSIFYWSMRNHSEAVQNSCRKK